MQPDIAQEIQGQAVDESAPLVFRTLGGEKAPATAVVHSQVEHLPAADLHDAIRTAREEVRREVESTLQQELDKRVQAEREHVANALGTFVSEKRRFFAGLEKEVVRLSLAIAERVLHRESSMDPTLLAGAARVALEQVDQDSAAVLLVPPDDAGRWKSALAGIGREVEFREDASLQHGQCLLQTEAGSFELGVRAQLCEIERGFFELLGRAPAVAV